MFTGIIQDIGTVVALDRQGEARLTIQVEKFPLQQTVLGASLSCAGVCLTGVSKTEKTFDVQVSAETLAKTTLVNWQSGTRVNLEPALRMGDELGGHLVSGHVDGVARVTKKEREGGSLRFQFEVAKEWDRFLAPKGSITIDGVSLTVNEVEASHLGVNIIPHTQRATTLGDLRVGSEVNFEVDLMARYAERLLCTQ